MKFPKFIIILASIISVVLGAGYVYVFILGAPQLDRPQEELDTGLKFELQSFNSKVMGVTRQYGIVLPPNYYKNTEKRYPVIFLLHGGHDDSRAYTDKYALLNILHELYKSDKLPPSIIITPDGNDKRGSSPLFDPDYFDGVNGKIGTLIGSELVQVVKKNYRTIEKPEFWAMGGVSSGGWGAFNIGLQHVDNFHILFSHSGYFTDKTGPQNSPQEIVKKLPVTQQRQLRIYLDAGTGEYDTEFLASTKAFHETLNSLGIKNVFNAFPGGHGLSGPDAGWNYFHKHLKGSLSYVGEQFKN